MGDVETDSDDGVLLRRWREQHDEEAFATLVERHRPAVVAWARAELSAAPHLADDAAQRVFLILAQESTVIGKPSGLRAWLSVTSRNVARPLNRSEVRRDRRERLAGEAEGAGTCEIVSSLHAAAGEALARLASPQREIIDLHLVQGLPRERVAQQVGCSLEALHKRLQMAKRALQDEFRRMGFQVPACLLVAALSTLLPAPAMAATLTASDRRPHPSPTRSAPSHPLPWVALAIVTVAGAGLALVAMRTTPDPLPQTVVAPVPAAPPRPIVTDPGGSLLGLDPEQATLRLATLARLDRLSLQERMDRATAMVAGPETAGLGLHRVGELFLPPDETLPEALISRLRHLGDLAIRRGERIPVVLCSTDVLATEIRSADQARAKSYWRALVARLGDHPGLDFNTFMVAGRRGTALHPANKALRSFSPPLSDRR